MVEINKLLSPNKIKSSRSLCFMNNVMRVFWCWCYGRVQRVSILKIGSRLIYWFDRRDAYFVTSLSYYSFHPVVKLTSWSAGNTLLTAGSSVAGLTRTSHQSWRRCLENISFKTFSPSKRDNNPWCHLSITKYLFLIVKVQKWKFPFMPYLLVIRWHPIWHTMW